MNSITSLSRDPLAEQSPKVSGVTILAEGLVVASVEFLGESVKRYILESFNRTVLPGFTAGAHISLCDNAVPSPMKWRAYSLMNYGLDSPDHYEIAMLRKEKGVFSAHAHQTWKVGTTLQARRPFNKFELHKGPGRRFLIGGGIGVTPVIGMATQLASHGEDFEVLYVCRNREAAVFLDELARLSRQRAHHCFTEDAGIAAESIRRFLSRAAVDDHVYACGPSGLMETAMREAARRGIPPSGFHHELFTPLVK